MSVEKEIKAAEDAVVNEVKKIEGEVVAEVKEIVKRARVEIEAAESLVLRTAETEFLRAQVEIRDLQGKMKEIMTKSDAASKKYAEQIEVLVKKYTIDKIEMIFDNIENVFKANPNAQAQTQVQK